MVSMIESCSSGYPSESRCQTRCSIESFVRMHLEVRKEEDRLDVPSARAWREKEHVLVSQGGRGERESDRLSSGKRVARLNRKERVDTCREWNKTVSCPPLLFLTLTVHTRDPSKRSHVFFNEIRDNKRIFPSIESVACLSFLDADERERKRESNGRGSDKSSDQWARLQSLTNLFSDARRENIAGFVIEHSFCFVSHSQSVQLHWTMNASVRPLTNSNGCFSLFLSHAMTIHRYQSKMSVLFPFFLDN